MRVASMDVSRWGTPNDLLARVGPLTARGRTSMAHRCGPLSANSPEARFWDTVSIVRCVDYFRIADKPGVYSHVGPNRDASGGAFHGRCHQLTKSPRLILMWGLSFEHRVSAERGEKASDA